MTDMPARPLNPASPLNSASPAVRGSAAKVLFVTPEMGGYLKAGGLGEVSAALPLAMARDLDVRVLLPGFPGVRDRHPNIEVVSSQPAAADLPPWSLGYVRRTDGLSVYVVLCDELYNREGSPYGTADGRDFPDNDIRFARLSHASALIAAGVADPNWKPDIVHANDWPSALAPGYLRWLGVDTPSILTIHNLAHQGLFQPTRLGALAIPEAAYTTEGIEFYGNISFLKSGILYASYLTTVSSTYAQEITTPAFGCGLHDLLADRLERGELSGILNGIDESWSQLANDAKAHGQLREWKRRKAQEVRELFGLAPSEGPLFSIVSRLVHQKGIDLSIDAADEIVKGGGQLVVTGCGEPNLEKAVMDLAHRHPGQISARIGFDDTQARSMFAGSDFLLMPSRFEPCGLSQMYAQSQGSLPIANRTGGLVDTIDDGRSGFMFSAPNAGSLRQAVARAHSTFRTKQKLGRMRRNAVAKKFSWASPAQHYRDRYDLVVGN